MTEADGPPEPILLTLPAQPRFLRIARLVAAGLANDVGADVDALDDVRLAVGEVCGLAIAAGAPTIDLRFEVSADSLMMSGEATPTPTPTPAALDPEHVRLAEQILRVATARYELTCHSNAVSFQLYFRSGR